MPLALLHDAPHAQAERRRIQVRTWMPIGLIFGTVSDWVFLPRVVSALARLEVQSGGC